MKLSDAIALGRTIKPAAPGRVGWTAEDPGCAIGMAQAAVGKCGVDITCVEIWPWLQNLRTALPCGCEYRHGYTDGANGTIAHLFDQHVFGAFDWTLDQLIDWVRSVEPSEPAVTPALADQEQLAPVEGASLTGGTR